MAKKKDDDIFNHVADKLNGEVPANEKRVPFFIDTGNLAFNWALSNRFLGGGIPGNRITEFFGQEASGKSYWAANIVRGAQAIGGIPIYLDCENALNNDFVVKTSHINLKRIVRFDPKNGADCLESCFLKIYNVIRTIREKDKESPIVIIYDSVSSSPSARALREIDLPENASDAEFKRIVGGKEQPGERAKILSKELPKLNGMLEKWNVTACMLNQTRLKIGVLYGDPTTTSGGEALKFYSSCRVKTSVSKKIEDKKLKVARGINLRIKNIKNRSCAPFREAEGVQLFWEDGVNPLSGLLMALEQAGRIEKVGQGSYKVAEPWAAGQEVKFRSSKARGDIEVDTLLKCPALVDGKDEQEVRDYIDIFSSAISQSNSDANEEITVKTDYDEDLVSSEE